MYHCTNNSLSIMFMYGKENKNCVEWYLLERIYWDVFIANEF